MSLRVLIIALTFATILFQLPVKAAEPTGSPKSLGIFGNWSAYTAHEGDQEVCYMLLISHPNQPPPLKTRGKVKDKAAKRGSIYLMITERPAEGSKDVVSYTAGYNFKPISDVKIELGKTQFSLFTQNDTAWSRDATTDRALAAAIRFGKSMRVTGVSVHGQTLTDTLDIKGSSAAYTAIGKACGLDVENPKSLPNKKKKSK